MRIQLLSIIPFLLQFGFIIAVLQSPSEQQYKSAFPFTSDQNQQQRQQKQFKNDDFIYNNCNQMPCNKVIQEYSREEAKIAVDKLFTDALGYFIYALSGMKAQVNTLIQYGVQVHKICAKCTDFEMEDLECYNDFCGPNAYGYDATFSGMLVVPTDVYSNTNGETISTTVTILKGIMKGVIWSHATKANTCDVPSEIWNKFDKDIEFDLIVPFLIASSGNAVVTPDNIGYGESYDHHVGFLIRKAYKTASVPLWLKAQEYIATETKCQSELGNSVVTGGYSEGGYGAVAVAEAMDKCMNVKVIKLFSGAAPIQISSLGTMELLGNVEKQRFPPEQMYTLILLGTAYSAYYPEEPILLADTWQYEDEERTSSQVMSLTTEGMSRSFMLNFIPQYPNDPLNILNQDFISDVSRIVEDNVADVCLDPNYDMTSTTEWLCPFLVENNLASYLQKVSYPFDLCHSPTDEVIPISNTLPLFSDHHIDVSGAHNEAALQCTRKFLNLFTTKGYKEMEVHKKSSSSNQLCHEEMCHDDATWFSKRGKKRRKCTWVRFNTKRCKKKNRKGILAKDACPIACKNEEACTIPQCLNNTEWEPKHGKFDNCSSIKGMNATKKRRACSDLGSDGKTFAYEACNECGVCK